MVLKNLTLVHHRERLLTIQEATASPSDRLFVASLSSRRSRVMKFELEHVVGYPHQLHRRGWLQVIALQ